MFQDIYDDCDYFQRECEKACEPLDHAQMDREVEEELKKKYEEEKRMKEQKETGRGQQEKTTKQRQLTVNPMKGKKHYWTPEETEEVWEVFKVHCPHKKKRQTRQECPCRGDKDIAGGKMGALHH